jgi:hypothetical protein
MGFGSLAEGICVADRSLDPDSLLGVVDFRAFFETLRLRWWVIPAVVAVAVGFLWAQESDLHTQPGSYYISRTYEARDSSAVLASVGVDPVSVRAFPDANNQLLILQSAAVREEIAAKLGNDATVTVARSKPSFSLIETLESDATSSFVFQSAGVPTYSFSCTEQAKADCESAIEAYVAKASDIRRDALTVGLNDLRAVLVDVQSKTNDASLPAKIAAIDALLERVDTPLVQISAYEEAIGPTTSDVSRPTYTFGVVAGLLIALLILLQLTYSDSRVRSLRQLARSVGDDGLLGVVSQKSNPIGERRVAVSLHRALALASAGTLRFLPLRAEMTDTTTVSRLAEMAGASHDVSRPFAELGVPELAGGTSATVDVIVVRRHRDLRKDAAEALAALRRSSRPVAGVLLVD